MAIRKQEFYEGAALHRLLRAGTIERIRYDAPFFSFNDGILVYFKYSTKGRSPWAFTLTPDEQTLLGERASQQRVIVGLVCGADGVAAVNYETLLRIAIPCRRAVHLACARRYNEHYQITGPDGGTDGKIAPSDWTRILDP